MPGDIRRGTNNRLITDTADLNHIVADKAVAPFNQFQSGLALSNPALSHNQDTLSKHVHQDTVNTDHRSKLHIEPADHFRHQIGSRLLRHHAGNPVMVAKLQHILLRLHSPAEEKTGNLAGNQGVIHLMSSLRRQFIEIGLLHISDNLHAVLVKMIKKSGQLQCRTIYIRMHQHNRVGIQLHCHIPKPQLFYQFRYRNSIHGPSSPSLRC